MTKTLIALALLLSFAAAVPTAFAAEIPAAAPATANPALSPLATGLHLSAPTGAPSVVEVPQWLEGGTPNAGCGNTCIICDRLGGLCCFMAGGGCFCSDFSSGCT